MKTNASLSYDKIHTHNKQLLLIEKFQAISAKIHARFPETSRVEHCPCCLSTEIQHYLIRFGYNIDKCESCDHLFTNPFPSPESLAYFYNSEYKEFENNFFAESFENRIPIFAYRLDVLKNYLDHGKKILDVGSALGIFYEANLRCENYFQIVCCDISSDACHLLSDKYPDAQVICCDFDDIECIDNLSCISLWDTLEHAACPDLILQKSRKLLSDDGLVAISTPNTHSLEWLYAGADHPQILPPGHVNLFNKDNILVLLERNGFKIISLSTPNASLDISYIIKLLNAISQRTGSDAALSILLKDPVLLKYIEESLIRQNYAGNMLVLASKCG